MFLESDNSSGGQPPNPFSSTPNPFYSTPKPTPPSPNIYKPSKIKNLVLNFLDLGSRRKMELTVVDLSAYLELEEAGVKELCGEVSRSPRETGAQLVKDPICTAEDNNRFLGMMERHFDSMPEFK